MSARFLLWGLLAAGVLLAMVSAIPVTPAGPMASAGSCFVRLNDDPTEYPSVQAAVDASTSPSDVVKVAGYCAGVEERAGLTQTVYLSKTLTLQGGYTLTNWSVPDPQAYPTTLDALGKGRVLLIYGKVKPHIAGLRLTGGEATRAGFDPYGHHSGGGLYAFEATATISDCVFYGNTAERGGGIFAYDSRLTMRGNTVTGNSAVFLGGGMLMYEGAGRLENNTFISNTAGTGGGAYFGSEAITLTGNAFLSNTVLYDGAGVIVEIYGSHSLLVGNTVAGNRAYWSGGGLYFGEAVRGWTGRLAGPMRAESAEAPCSFRQEGGERPASVVEPTQGRHLLFSGNLIARNWARNDGGGVFMGGDGGAADFIGNTVLENEAGRNGGGIYLDWSADPTPILSNTVGANIARGNGGGIYLGASTATLRGNTVRDNWANGDGGGIYGRGHIEANAILSNTASWGGGLCGGGTVVGNTFSGNVSSKLGGGMFGDGAILANVFSSNTSLAGGGLVLEGGAAAVVGNTFISNTARDGGGLVVKSLPAVLMGNVVIFNRAERNGGGVVVDQADSVALSANRILSNVASSDGGGLLVESSIVTLTNNWIAANRAGGQGSGLFCRDAHGHLLHNTIADNGGISVYVGGSAPLYGSLWMTNTILLGHTVGITVAAGCTATLEATLWGNATDWAGPGTILTGTVNLWGDPDFIDPAGGDYHIGPTSAARDVGVEAGVYTDIDGDPRPLGTGYDLGADESPPVYFQIYLPLVLH